MYMYILGLIEIHVRWVACHHGMACPHAADGGDSLQIWKVAANILNKQSWTADSIHGPCQGVIKKRTGATRSMQLCKGGREEIAQ
jgi:hypothetical protein